MNATSCLLRLGLVLSGTNADLVIVSDDGNGSGHSEASPDENEEGEGSGSSLDEKEKDRSPSSFKDEGGEGGKDNGTADSNTAGTGDSSSSGGVLQQLLEAMQNAEDNGMVEQQEALAQAVREAMEESDVREDEMAWSPLSTEGDKIVRPNPSDAERRRADKIMKSVAKETAFLTARLRNKFLEARSKRVMHGVRRGDGLSDRRLADSWAEIQSGIAPTRPDYANTLREDVSLAVALILDESGSMDQRRKDASRAMAAILSPLDSLGCPCMAAGFRDGDGYLQYPYDEKYDSFHRHETIAIDLFKGWNERLRSVLGNIACTNAQGSTPMADGIQYGLQELSERRERHRVMLVLTDGEADYRHRPVMKRQIRLAREAGITIVGVGIDEGCFSVARTFDQYIQVNKIEELPEALLKVLSEIIFPARGGRRVELDGRMSFRAA